jgi:hypothetical protein
MKTALDHASSAAIGAPLSYPHHGSQSSAYLIAGSDGIPGATSRVPMSSIEELQKYIDWQTAKSLAESVVTFKTQYSDLVSQGARQLGSVHRKIVAEYISTNVRDEALFIRLANLRRTAIAELMYGVEGIQVSHIAVKELDAGQFEHALREAARIRSLPEQARLSGLPRSIRELVLASEANRVKIVNSHVWTRIAHAKTLLVVADFIDPGVRIATSTTYADFKIAVADVAKTAAKWAAGELGYSAGAAGAAAIAACFALTPPGWVLIAVGATTGLATGIYFDHAFAERVKTSTIKAFPELPGLP